jgi:hypothetical protein
MFRNLLGIAAAAALAVGVVTGAPPAPAHATTCGNWRWPVKTGADATRSQVSTTVRKTSIGYLDGLTPPSSFGSYAQNHRIKSAEFHVWQLTDMDLVAIKLEDDGDLHLRLRTWNRAHQMIAEVPNPSCVSSISRWKKDIASTRQAITSRYWVSSHRWHYLYKAVTLRGLGFFDEEHNVTGAAPNDIELHPAIYIHFP